MFRVPFRIPAWSEVAALFIPSRHVDSVTASLSTTARRLGEANAHHLSSADAKTAKAAKLRLQALDHTNEAAHAQRVAEKLNTLLS